MQHIALPQTGRFNFTVALALPMIVMRAFTAVPRYFMRRNLGMRHGNAQSLPLCCSVEAKNGVLPIRTLSKNHRFWTLYSGR
jgi:hypothetical protein